MTVSAPLIYIQLRATYVSPCGLVLMQRSPVVWDMMQKKSMFKSVKTQTACNFVNAPCYRPKFLLALKRAKVSLLRRITMYFQRQQCNNSIITSLQYLVGLEYHCQRKPGRTKRSRSAVYLHVFIV